MENITSEPAPVTITEMGSLKSKNINLWEKLLEDINRQFEEQYIIMTQGRIKIIDSTPIQAAQSGLDKDKNGAQKNIMKQTGMLKRMDAFDALWFGWVD